MNRLVRRQRAALALFIALAVSGVGVALAAPQSGDNPSVTLDVSPNDGQNLADSQAITVTGAGFQQGGVGTSGILVQTADLPNGTTAVSPTLGTWTSTGAGTFTSTVTVTRTFVAEGSGDTIDCAVVQCYVEAFSNNGAFNSRHTISFGGGTTTSSSTSSSSSTSTSTSTSTTMQPTTSSSTSTSTTQQPTTTSSTSTSTTQQPTTTSSTSTSTTMQPTTSSSTSTSTTQQPTTTSSSSTSTTQQPTTTSSTSTSTTLGGTTTTLGGTTTTVFGGSQCALLRSIRATFNAQIDAAKATISRSSLSAAQKAALFAQLEAIRARGLAQINALLAGCPS